MPYEIAFQNLPAGYAVNAARGGEKVEVCLRDFISSEDGDELIVRLEGLPQQVLSMLPPPAQILPSAVHTLLVVIRKNKTATVYLNEVKPIGEMRIKGACNKGEMITADRVLDIGRMRFPDVEIPPDAGVVYVFSVGWRKGFYYDLSPLHDEHGKPRGYDLDVVIGGLYAYLLFQERFKIDDATWQILFAQKWFPFVHLDDGLLREMISHAKQGWQIDDLLPKISSNVERLLRESPLGGKADRVFSDHADLLKTATERYLAGDYVSCTSILYPRIEGLLRSFYRAAGYMSSPTAKSLGKVAIEHYQTSRISLSLLLPAKFHDYLERVYFAHFSPGSAPDVGRHSVAHGEARPEAFSLKASTIGFLIVYQLSVFFSDGRRKQADEQAPAAKG